MIDVAQARVGDKVHYKPEHYNKNRWDNGRIKEIVSDEGYQGYVRVVYRCGGNWAEFERYTAVLTSSRDLFPGWRHK